MFICPILYLFYVQMTNLFVGKTTFERFGAPPPKSKIVDDEDIPST